MPPALTIAIATDADVPGITRVRVAAAEALTAQFGKGHWSTLVREDAVRRSLKESRVVIARAAGDVCGTLRLATKKPWAIDPRYFTPVRKAIYLLDMAVHPNVQRQGVGHALMNTAAGVARAAGFAAIRLDAYDAAAGAAGFYAKCGYEERGRVGYRGVGLVYFERVL